MQPTPAKLKVAQTALSMGTHFTAMSHRDGGGADANQMQGGEGQDQHQTVAKKALAALGADAGKAIYTAQLYEQSQQGLKQQLAQFEDRLTSLEQRIVPVNDTSGDGPP